MTDLLELALDAHGGLARWHEINRIDLKLSVNGNLFRIKGFPDGGLRDVALQVGTREIATTFTPYAGGAKRGHFAPQRVWISDAEDRLVEEMRSPRASFAGHVLTTPWNELQCLYFMSYSIWNYLSTPFLFTRPGFRLREIEPHEEHGEVWRRLLVRFPSDIPTHCAEQTFFFDVAGLLQRVDYVTDLVAGGVASHYCFDHADFGGLKFPTLRRVVRRGASGPMLSSPTAVLLQLSDIVIA